MFVCLCTDKLNVWTTQLYHIRGVSPEYKTVLSFIHLNQKQHYSNPNQLQTLLGSYDFIPHTYILVSPHLDSMLILSNLYCEPVSLT